MWLILAVCCLSAIVIMFGLVICYLVAELHDADKRQLDLRCQLQEIAGECESLELQLSFMRGRK